jgi:uncharacterized membrane protein YwaF
MRTAVIIVAGFVLWGLCLAVAKFATGGTKQAFDTATAGFVALWLAVAAGNMWMGVARAGYSVREELPIFLVIFLVPAMVAVVVRWKLL